MKQLAFIFLFLLASQQISSAEEPPLSFHKSGKFKSGIAYEFFLEESPFHTPAGKQPEIVDDGSFWGVEGGYPRFVVTKMSLSINGKDIFILRRHFSDLNDVNSIEVLPLKGGLKIVLHGGDAAGGYSSIFIFKNGRLVERFTHNGEFPDFWERITLHEGIPND